MSDIKVSAAPIEAPKPKPPPPAAAPSPVPAPRAICKSSIQRSKRLMHMCHRAWCCSGGRPARSGHSAASHVCKRPRDHDMPPLSGQCESSNAVEICHWTMNMF